MESAENCKVQQLAEMREQEMLRTYAPADMPAQLLCKLIDNRRKACGPWALEFLSSVYEMVRMTLTREQLLAAVEQADTLEHTLEEELASRDARPSGLRLVEEPSCCEK